MCSMIMRTEGVGVGICVRNEEESPTPTLRFFLLPSRSVFNRDGHLLYVNLSMISDSMQMVFMCMFALGAFRKVRMTSRRKVYIIGLYL